MDSNLAKFAQLTGSLVYIHDQLAGIVNGCGLAKEVNPQFNTIYKYLPIAERRKWYLCGEDGICARVKGMTERLFAVLDAEAKKPTADLGVVYKLTYLHNVYDRAVKWLKDNPASKSFFDWAVSLPKSVSWGSTAADTMLEYAFLGGKAYGVPYVK